MRVISKPKADSVNRITNADDIARIEAALDRAQTALAEFTPGEVEARMKSGDDPLTAADLAVDKVLRETLPLAGEGWLSEETIDNADRLTCGRAWIVDPIDGTREFVMGIPEWCVSIALVVDGVPVAGGILNPGAGHRIVGSVDEGVTLNGESVTVTTRSSIAGALVLASRSEVKRGEWDPFFRTPISVRTMGSVAYKIGCVAVGLADATWTLVPKNEWDVAGGAALLRAAGGSISGPNFEPVSFNNPDPLMPGFVATNGPLREPIASLIGDLRSSI
jgi:myo-inositol-1(or 4)-monophosphatase